MNTLFKKHQKVKLLRDPNPEYIEYHTELTGSEEVPIKKGMIGIINLILPNGDYHIKILDKNGEELAYVTADEQSLKAI